MSVATGARWVVCAAVCALSPAGLAQQPPRSGGAPAGVIEKARQAAGFEALRAHPGALEITGQARAFAGDGSFTLTWTPDGRFASTFDGPLDESAWFDGTTLTARDFNDSVYEVRLGERESAMVEFLVRSGLWLGEDHGLRLTRAAGAPIGGAAVGVEMGAYKGTLVLDKAGLPAELRRRDSGVDLVTTFADWRDAAGIKVAGLVEQRRGGEVVRREAASEVITIARPDDAAFAPEPGFPADTAFDPAVPAALKVHRAPTGHLLVPLSINGTEPKWFIFDSGAGAMTIDTALADELGMPTLGAIDATGAGGSERAAFRRADSVRVGPMTIDGLNFIALDLSPLSPYFGVDLAGVIGFALFQRCVSETDLAGATVALHDPRTYTLSRGHWQDLTLESRHPCVEAEFEGRRGLFILDTGAANLSVTFHAPAVRDLALLDGRQTTPSASAGVGGQVPTRAGHLADITLAGHRFDRPRASFATEDRGAFANASVLGTIGGELLLPFVLVTDYHNGRLALVERGARE